jgi:hypothetical protein
MARLGAHHGRVGNGKRKDAIGVRLGLVVVALAVAAIFAGAAVGSDDETPCSGELHGVTVERLVVPAGQTCTVTHVVVNAGVIVGQDATLLATDIVVGDGIRAFRGGTLQVGGGQVEIGGDVIARDAVLVSLSRSGLLGSTYRIGGDVIVGGAEEGVGIGGITIDGDVRVFHSGAENGVGLAANVIGGSAAIVDNTIVGANRPSAIDVFENTVGDDLIVSRNDATNAYEPTFVGSNLVLHGDLTCRHNIPDVVNDPPGGPYPNTVVEGEKIGQCAEL